MEGRSAKGRHEYVGLGAQGTDAPHGGNYMSAYTPRPWEVTDRGGMGWDITAESGLRGQFEFIRQMPSSQPRRPTCWR